MVWIGGCEHPWLFSGNGAPSANLQTTNPKPPIQNHQSKTTNPKPPMQNHQSKINRREAEFRTGKAWQHRCRRPRARSQPTRPNFQPRRDRHAVSALAQPVERKAAWPHGWGVGGRRVSEVFRGWVGWLSLFACLLG